MKDSIFYAYFSILDRDGNGDFDGDGTSDRVEYQMGSDPTDPVDGGGASMLPAYYLLLNCTAVRS